METQNLRELKLSSIRTNPNNPRKSFNTQSIEELAASIKAQGVLQPIIVKNINDTDSSFTFEIVCGERRFRAAQLAELTTIPAIIQLSLSDNQYYEIAITENLQRENISPLEEMQVYTTMIEQNGYTTEALAARFGKNIKYIRSRICLMNLIDIYHSLLQTADITLAVALELCKYSKDVQNEIYDNHYSDDVTWQNWKGGNSNEIIQSIQYSYSTNIDDFFFDKSDCINCKFNSQQDLSLFAESSDSNSCGRCMNQECLNSKNTIYIVERAITTHEQNPELPIARNKYSYDKNAVEELISKGYNIEIVDYCRDCATPPIVEDYDSDEEYQADLAYYIEDSQDLVDKYQKGEIKMYALIENRGVKLKYTNVNSSTDSNHVEAETPLLRLQKQDIRNSEIAVEKTIDDTKELIKGLDTTVGDFSLLEEQIIYFAMMEHLRREHYEMVGLSNSINFLTDEHRFSVVQNLTEEIKTILRRDYIVATLKNAYRGNYTAVMLNMYAEQHAISQVVEIRAKHNDVYTKRHLRIEEKIAAINSTNK